MKSSDGLKSHQHNSPAIMHGFIANLGVGNVVNNDDAVRASEVRVGHRLEPNTK